MEETKELLTKAAFAPDPNARAHALGQLVERFQDMAVAYAYCILGDYHLAEDAAQDAFVVAFGQLGKLRQPEAFPGWFRRIVWSACGRFLRRKSIPAIALDTAAPPPSAAAEPSQILDQVELRDNVLRAIGQLGPAQREIATLFYVDGYSQRYIADFFELPLTTIKSRLFDSRHQIRERVMHMYKEMLAELKTAMEAYGLKADAIEPMSGWSCFVETFRVTCSGRDYVARIRDARATPAEVFFAAKWARVVSAEVPVPLGLVPNGGVPRVQGKCVDVCPYIQHEHTRGGSVPPEAWLKVGYWLGCLHRLGASLAAEAPIDLPYGNYPSDKLVAQCLNHARRQVPSQYDAELSQAQNMLVKAQAFLEPRRSSLPQGVVHGDLHFWNVLYSGQQAVAIVDLDFLQRGYLIADLAFESEWLIAWERDRGGPWLGIMDRYIAAYEQGRRDPLTDIEKQCLPWARLVNHVFFFFQNIAGACHDEDKWRGDLNSAKNLAQAK